MVSLSVCIGSACHLRGAHGVLEAFNALIKKYQIRGTVDVAGNFCQGRCTEGVVIKINDEIITNVTKDQVYEIFTTKILER